MGVKTGDSLILPVMHEGRSVREQGYRRDCENLVKLGNWLNWLNWLNCGIGYAHYPNNLGHAAVP